MKLKPLPALVLSLAVVAGAMTITSDAYAQSNTDRLVETVENTRSANELLNALEDVLDTITERLTNIVSLLGGLDGDVSSISDNVAQSTDVAAARNSVDELSAGLSELEEAVNVMENNRMADGDGYRAGIGTIVDILDDLESAVATQTSDDDSSMSDLSAKVDQLVASSETTKTRLTAIEDALGGVTTSVSTPKPTATLQDTKTEHKVGVLDFARGYTSSAATVKIDFTCDADVFLKTADAKYLPTTVGDGQLFTSDGPPPTAGETLKVEMSDGVVLYERPYTYSTGVDPVILDTTHTFESFDKLGKGESRTFTLSTNQVMKTLDGSDLMAVPVGGGEKVQAHNNTLNIQNIHKYLQNSTQIRVQTDADSTADDDHVNITLSTLEKNLVELTVEWISSTADAECKFEIARDTSALTETEDVVVQVEASGTGLIKAINSGIVVNCNAERTEVTGAEIKFVGTPEHPEFIDIELKAAGDVLAKFNYVDEELVIEEGSLPFEFSNTALEISGSLSTEEFAYLTLDYNTVDNNECSAD